MIPKKIYYCWFGNSPKNKLIKKCIKSWKKHCSSYEIIEINENNFNINTNRFCKKAYQEKKWAFVSDYARLEILYKNGGIYLDTDMELLKNIDIFLKNKCFFGFESNKVVNGAIMGANKNNNFIKKCLNNYHEQNKYINIPVIITNELKKMGMSDYGNQKVGGVSLYETEYFYPIKFREKYSKDKISKNTYGIHWWETSWYPWYYKIIKKFGLLCILPKLGKIKNIILSKLKGNSE